MFNFIEKTVGNILDVTVKTFDILDGGSGPSKEQVVKLIADGLTIGAIAHGFGISEDVVEHLLEE